MPKATKKPATKRMSTMEVGATVEVITRYRVKGFRDNLVQVEDDRGDRVLNFRLSELKLVEEVE